MTTEKYCDTIEAGARIALSVLKEWIAPDDLDAIKRGEKHPGDCCDDNIAWGAAFYGIHFRDIDARSESDAEWWNAVYARAMAILRCKPVEYEADEMMDTDRYCDTLTNLDPAKAVKAIQQALIQLRAADRGVENLDNTDAIAALTECLRDAGHMGYTS